MFFFNFYKWFLIFKNIKYFLCMSKNFRHVSLSLDNLLSDFLSFHNLLFLYFLYEVSRYFFIDKLIFIIVKNYTLKVNLSPP